MQTTPGSYTLLHRVKQRGSAGSGLSHVPEGMILEDTGVAAQCRLLCAVPGPSLCNTATYSKAHQQHVGVTSLCRTSAKSLVEGRKLQHNKAVSPFGVVATQSNSHLH